MLRVMFLHWWRISLVCLALKLAMAAHSSTLAWSIPGTGEPGGLPSMGLHRVRHDCSDLASAALKFVGPWLSLGFSVGMEAFG